LTSSSTSKVLAGTAVLSLAVFIWISWPLTNYWSEGIPSSAQNIENPSWRYMIKGDHLQLLYHFDLVRDQITGRIPPLHNIFEFNTGDDAMRFRVGSYFVPMSGVYALLSLVFGQAAAWNATMLISVWFSALFSWLWLRRFTSDGLASGIALIVIMVSPFRWISLFGGSPSGIALMWLPLLAWSIDTVARRASYAAGGWLGLSLLLLYLADIHAFYFGVLASPLFLAMSWSHVAGSASPPRINDWLKIVPGVMVATAVIALFFWWRHQYISDSTMSGGRDEGEISKYSATASALLFGGGGKRDHMFIGVIALLLFLIAFVSLSYRAIRLKQRLVLATSILVFVAFIIGAWLSLGFHGPLDGLAIKAARSWLPGYGMIRQPAKIFCVMPMLMAWMIAVGFSRNREGGILIPRRYVLAMVAAAVAVAAESMAKLSATICLLDRGDDVYAHVVKDAEGKGLTPVRAIAVPLWPGDSDETSVPVFYAHKHGIRLFNGYSPVVPKNYYGQVRMLDSMNQGFFTDEQASFLLELGIHHVVVHEDMYPEKVAPFPVGLLLNRLDSHPRLSKLSQNGSIHAYEILQEPTLKEQTAASKRIQFPARRWEVDREENMITDITASGGQFWRAGGDSFGPARPARIAPQADLCWWIRLRGTGRANFVTFVHGAPLAEEMIELASTNWIWETVALPDFDAFAPVSFALRDIDGEVDLDCIMLGTTAWSPDLPEDGLVMPAADFFHAGHTLDDGTSVKLRASHEPDSVILYGPGLPVREGDYHVSLNYSAEAPAGVVLADWIVKQGGDEIVTPVMASNAPLTVRWTATSNLPLVIQLRYHRQADMVIESVKMVEFSE
jgi:hypothetical protein